MHGRVGEPEGAVFLASSRHQLFSYPACEHPNLCPGDAADDAPPPSECPRFSAPWACRRSRRVWGGDAASARSAATQAAREIPLTECYRLVGLLLYAELAREKRAGEAGDSHRLACLGRRQQTPAGFYCKESKTVDRWRARD